MTAHEPISLSLRIIEFRIPRLEERGDLGPPNLGMEDRFDLRPLLCGSIPKFLWTQVIRFPVRGSVVRVLGFSFGALSTSLSL